MGSPATEYGRYDNEGPQHPVAIGNAFAVSTYPITRGQYRRFVAATVVRTQGSTPQVVGARLIVDDRDEYSGTLGGGCVEGDAITEARRLLAELAKELSDPLVVEEVRDSLARLKN